MDNVPRLDRQVIDDRFRQTGTRNGRLLVLPSPQIGSTEWAKPEQLSNHNPPKPKEKRININPRQSPGKDEECRFRVRPGADCKSARGHRPRSHDAVCLRAMSFEGARIVGTYIRG
jgi:hypothetical protein